MSNPLALAAMPLDAVRSFALARCGRAGKAFLRERGLRVSAQIAIGLFVTLATTLAAPGFAFLFGPLVLGIPHLLSDVRYLVVKPGFHRRPWLVATVGGPLLLSAVTGNVALGLASGFGAIALGRRRFALVLWPVVVAAAYRWSYVTTLLLVHGHNFLAIALFCAAFAREGRNRLMLAGGFVVIAAAIMSGLFDPVLSPRLLDLARTIAPVRDPVLAMRLVTLFVFAQGAHYVVWLRLVPDEARERPGVRSFRSTFEALRHDLGAPVLLVAGAFALLLAARAFTSLEAARLLYLRGASFHGFVEIAFALHVWSRR